MPTDNQMPPMANLATRMADLDRERALVKSQLDRERLTEITGDLIRTITSPKFIEKMRQFREKAVKGGGFDEAADLMSLESLRDAGARIPDDFRLTSRVFEDLDSGLKVAIDPRGWRTAPGLDDVAWGACAGGGAGTVCGCAGGGT